MPLRKPPVVPPPMPGDEVGEHLVRLCAALNDLTAWIGEAVAIVAGATDDAPQSEYPDCAAGYPWDDQEDCGVLSTDGLYKCWEEKADHGDKHWCCCHEERWPVLDVSPCDLEGRSHEPVR